MDNLVVALERPEYTEIWCHWTEREQVGKAVATVTGQYPLIHANETDGALLMTARLTLDEACAILRLVRSGVEPSEITRDRLRRQVDWDRLLLQLERNDTTLILD